MNSTKEIRVLKKFYNLLENNADDDHIEILTEIWNKYKNKFDLNNIDIYEIYQKIECFLEKIPKKEIDFHNIDCNNIYDKKHVIKKYIEKKIQNYIEILKENTDEVSIDAFINWFDHISTCIDLNSFKYKMNELIFLYNKKYGNNYNYYEFNPNESNYLFLYHLLMNLSVLMRFLYNRYFYLLYLINYTFRYHFVILQSFFLYYYSFFSFYHLI